LTFRTERDISSIRTPFDEVNIPPESGRRAGRNGTGFVAFRALSFLSIFQALSGFWIRFRINEGYSKGRQIYKGKRTTKKVFKKNFCTKEDISSSDEDEFSDNETQRVLFMSVEDSDKEDSEEEYEEAYEEEIEEAEVDFQEELMSAIEVIRREKKKNKKL
jgi:hypothetical protein